MKIALNWRRWAPDDHPEISLEIRPLTVEAMFKCATAVGTGGGDLIRSQSILMAAQEVFPEHVRNLTGIEVTDEQGNQRSGDIADLTQQPVLMSIASDIVASLINISLIGDTDEKNSARPSPKSGASAASPASATKAENTVPKS